MSTDDEEINRTKKKNSEKINNVLAMYQSLFISLYTILAWTARGLLSTITMKCIDQRNSVCLHVR